MGENSNGPDSVARQERLIEELRNRLAEAGQEHDFLMYAISHDLRAPLRTLYGFSTLLIKKYGDKLEEQPRDYLQRIIAGAARMEAMIEELLKLSRIGRAEIRHEPIDLSGLADALIGELRAADPARRVEVEVEQGLSCHGDPGMLRTVLHNLLQNAWKFTAGTPSPRIQFFARHDNGEHWYCVKDNGAGFAANQTDRLFKPFQRLHLDTEFPGVGMGLALVKKIISRHGGNVRAEGEEGTGANFCFSLPARTD